MSEFHNKPKSVHKFLDDALATSEVCTFSLALLELRLLIAHFMSYTVVYVMCYTV